MSNSEVRQITERIARRIMRLLERRRLVLLCHKMLKPAPGKGFSMFVLKHQNRLKPAVYADSAYFCDTVVLGPQADSEEADPLSRDQPLLAELDSASAQGRLAVGPQAGNYLLTDGIQAEPGKSGSMVGPRCTNELGFRLRLRLCRTSQSPCQCLHSNEGAPPA
jgi:hypothetical protein